MSKAKVETRGGWNRGERRAPTEKKNARKKALKNSRAVSTIGEKKLGRPYVYDINELYAKTGEFFEMIDADKQEGEDAIIPTKTMLLVYLGVPKSTWQKWREGTTDKAYTEFVELADNELEMRLEQGILVGGVNPIYGIWQEKTRFGYIEKTEQSITVNNIFGHIECPEALNARLLEDFPDLDEVIEVG